MTDQVEQVTTKGLTTEEIVAALKDGKLDDYMKAKNADIAAAGESA